MIIAFFIYDASTYRDDPAGVEIAVSDLALNPKRGGPKNLPIVEYLLDDDESDEAKRQKHKPKLVILGTGWGSVAMLKKLQPDDYHVVVISPSNHFLFTPMLPSATVGTLEFRSLVEPVRRIIGRAKGHFLKGNAIDVDMSSKLVEVQAVDESGVSENFYVPYDKLVIGVGELLRLTVFCWIFRKLDLRFDRRCHKSTRCKRPRTLPLLERYHRCAKDT